jgi:hypothetical protein
MTDYPVDNAQSISSVSDNTPTVGGAGRATSPNMGPTVMVPGTATTPNPSLVVSAPVRAASSTTMTAGV